MHARNCANLRAQAFTTFHFPFCGPTRRKSACAFSVPFSMKCRKTPTLIFAFFAMAASKASCKCAFWKAAACFLLRHATRTRAKNANMWKPCSYKRNSTRNCAISSAGNCWAGNQCPRKKRANCWRSSSKKWRMARFKTQGFPTWGAALRRLLPPYR